MRDRLRAPLRTLLVGTALGLLILGVGGRLVMALVAAQTGARPTFTLGGSATVVFLGAVSGAAGALIAIVSRAIATRFARGAAWAAFMLFGAGLLLVTMRGLRGSPAGAHAYFYGLVVLYGVALALLDARARQPAAAGQSQRPGRLASE